MVKKIVAAIKANRTFFKWLTSKPSVIVGVDIGSSFVKAAEVSFAKRNPVLKAIGIAPIPNGIIREGQISNVEALAAILDKLWEENGLTCRDTVAAVDGRSAFVREVMFPPLKPEEIKETVKWNEKEYIPYEQNSYYSDFAIINSESDVSDKSKCRVLLAAARLKAVDDIVGLFKMINCKIWSINIEHLAAKLTMESYSDKKSKSKSNFEDSIKIVLDIGHTCSKVILFSRDIPVSAKIIPFGGERFTKIIMRETGLGFFEAEKFKLSLDNPDFKLIEEQFLERRPYLEKEFKYLVVDLVGEIRRAIEYYFMEKPNVEGVYLIGGGSALKNLAENIEDELGEIPIKVHNPLNCIEISPLLDRDYLNSIAPQFTIAIGLALSGGIYDSN